MSIPIDVKAPLLESFYLKLEEDGWNFTGCASLRWACRHGTR